MTSRTRISITLVLAAAFCTISPLHAQSPACGDCDGDGVTSILDALSAAQYQLGMGAIAEGNLNSCNAFEDDKVDVLDVFLIARQAVGYEGAVTECFPVDTRAQITSTGNLPLIEPVGNGLTTVEFILSNPLYESTTIEVFFALVNGVYIPATPAPQQPVNGLFGTTAAPLSAAFIWDSQTDLPPGTEGLEIVIVRVQTYSIHEGTRVPGEAINRVYSY